MSYFIKNGAGQCYSDKEGYTPIKYAGVLSESTKAISSISGTPYIAITDASSPVNCDINVSSYSEAVKLLNEDQIETKYHRCIFVGSFQSRSEDYTITWNSAENRIDSTLNWKNKTWNYKELFAGNKSIVSYLTNREYGDVLSFKLNDPRSLENYFRPLEGDTYGPDTSATDDLCLLSNYSESWKGNGDTDAYNELDTDLSASIGHKVYYFRQEPETQKPEFGYTFKTNSADISNKGDLSYFTLDLNEIPSNKKHLKLQYFWNILFNNREQFSDPIAEIQTRFINQSFNSSHMFLYNYKISNNSAWNTSDSGVKYELGVNLQSSIKKVNGNWSADESFILKDAIFKTFKNSNPELDYWNDVKTYNRLYVTWANNESESGYENNVSGPAQKIFVNGDNGKKYITTIGCICVANGEDHDTYSMDIERGTSASIYLNDETVLAEANKDIVSGDSFNADDWTIIDKSLYMVTAHKYNITEGWLSEQSGWGPYSGSFIPYVSAHDNYCYWDYDHSTDNYSFTEPPPPDFCGTYLWRKVSPSPSVEYEEFSRDKCYSAGTYVRDYFGDTYEANVDVMSGYTIDSMAYNESLFSFKNSRNSTNQYNANANSYNYIGHSEYTIDLSGVQEKYIHISNPATYLFDSPLGCSGNMNPFVTDFKMTYEAID